MVINKNKDSLTELLSELGKFRDIISLESPSLTYTFHQLLKKCQHVANVLISQGIKSGDVIAVYSNYSPFAVIVMIGIFKIGAIYLPLNIENSKEFNNIILKDSEATAIVIKPEYASDSFGKIKIINLATIDANDTVEISNSVLNDAIFSDEMPAYIMYTSGTTGKPKGVVIERGALARHISAYNQVLNFGQGNRYFGLYSLAFDASIEMMLPLLVQGITLVFGPKVENFEKTWPVIVEKNYYFGSSSSITKFT